MVLKDFDKNLEKYAKLLISTGINVQPGHTVNIVIDVDQAPLARLLVKEAYAHGASEVIVSWADDFVGRERLLHAAEDRISNVPEYRVAEMNYLLEKKASRLNVRSADPDAFAGVSAERLQQSTKALSLALKPLRTATQANKVSWTVASAAGKEWAKKVFPNAATDEEAVDLLWDQIFKTCRVYADDPVAAWKEHEEKLDAKAAMPTEEVFSAPDFRVAEGYVSSTKPLSYNGNIIEGIKVTFKDGQITEVSAEKGDQVMKDLVFENNGARGLGEVALVSDPSPISQSGITFFNTLFDENASNHLAIGSAYATSVKGGENFETEEELREAGLNRADVHVDFMIGGPEMNVDGIREDGTVVPIFRNGDWAI